MKKVVIVIIIAVMGFSAQSFSQIENIICTDDSTLVIDNIYAGILSSVNFSAEDLTSTSSYDFRVGAMATWHITKWADVKTYGMYDRNNGGDGMVNSFSINLHKNRWDVEFGKMSTTASYILVPSLI